MHEEYNQCLTTVVISHAESAAFSFKAYEDAKDPTYLKLAAFGVYKMTYYALMLYEVLQSNQGRLNDNFNDLADYVSEHCEYVSFLKYADASKWADVRNVDLETALTHGDFYNRLLGYARGLQYFYNEQVVPRIKWTPGNVNCDWGDHQGLSKFN